MLQVALPSEKVLTMNLCVMGVFTKDDFPKILKLILENYSLACAGRNAEDDCTRLIKLGVNIKNQVELRNLALNYDLSISAKGEKSFSNLCRVQLKLELPKTHQLVDYSTIHSSSYIIENAALDALVLRK